MYGPVSEPNLVVRTLKPQTLTLCIKNKTITRVLASPKLVLLEAIHVYPITEAHTVVPWLYSGFLQF